MGCWNETCMISSLPIRMGEKVKLLFLNNGRKKISGSSFVYPYDILKPSFLPIVGEYNNYGIIENPIEDWNYTFIEEFLKKKVFKDKIWVDNEEIKNWNLLDIIRGIEREKLEYFGKEDIIKQLFTKSSVEEKQKSNLKFILIREDIWNHIVQNYKGEFINIFDEEPKNIYLSAKEYYKKEWNKKSDREFRLMRGGIFTNTCKWSFLSGVEYEIFLNNNRSLENDIFNKWFEMNVIDSFISETRRSYMLQSGGGSQNDSFDEHKLLAEKIIEICDLNKENYE